MVRFYSVVAPGELGDFGYAYLRGLLDSGVSVRALPVGPSAALGTELRWWRISKAFTCPLTVPYINVICVRPGLMTGVRTPVASLGTMDDLPTDMPPALARHLAKSSKQAKQNSFVYEPQPVIQALFTVGCPNVAIVTTTPQPSPLEVEALAKYDLVITPTAYDQEQLEQLGIRSMLIPMHAVGANDSAPDPYRNISASGRADLVLALEALCASGTTLTTVLSVATAEPLATTSPPSSRSQTSSSRSSASTTGRRRRSRDTPTSTDSSSTTSTTSTQQPALQRMWRFITRLLGF